MSISKNNIVIHGMSGGLGDLLVFRQREGATIASAKPREREGELSVNQQAVNTRFQQAVLYAKGVNADPDRKAEYKAAAGPRQSGYNIAIADFFNGPDIDTIDVSTYTGRQGDKINIKVTDNFKVKSVRVVIMNQDGSIIDDGDAVMAADGINWEFTAASSNASLAGDKIIVYASDYPDNLTQSEKTL